MTTRNAAVARPTGDDTAIVATWTGLASGDDGSPLQHAPWSDRSVQVSGTFGAGGTLVLEGSNDGTNWAVLNDAFGTALNITTAGIKQITQAALYMRPRVQGGDGATSLTVALLARTIFGRRG